MKPRLKHYRRFTAAQSIGHGILMASFLGLVGTGMPLLFSQAAWSVWLSHALGGFAVMGVFHRMFALVLSGLFLFHVADLVHRLYAKREYGLLWGPDSLVPQPQDAFDMLAHLRFFLGLGPQPRFGRFTYWEKFDYFAVFWGMLIIGVSGFVLWFHAFFARFVPGWVFNIALLIHGDEGLLAGGFIFTIHFFNSHLRPEKFPMDMVIFTGRVTEEELRHERPLQWDALVASGRLAEMEDEPPPPWLLRLGRIVGTTAVAIGLALVSLILFAVFGH